MGSERSMERPRGMREMLLSRVTTTNLVGRWESQKDRTVSTVRN